MNVIVVVCNSLHLGFLGAYGNAWIETPNLDRLAAEGVVFDHHFPENLTTLPTRRSWWTGPLRVRRPRAGLDAAAARRADPARPALEPGGPHGPDLRRPAAPRGRAGVRPGLRRGDLGPRPGLRPARPAGDPRRRKRPARGRAGPAAPARGRPRLRTLEEALGAVPAEPGRAPDRRRGEHRRGADGPRGDRLARAAGRPSRDPFLLWLDLFSPHGPWDPPQPYRDQYATAEPDEFEAGEEGDLVEDDWRTRRSTSRRSPVLIDVPAGAVGDVIDEAELLRLRRTYAGTVTLVDRWLGELFDALEADGPDGRHPGRLHQRPGRAAGRARLRPPVPPLALRGADPHAADRPDARRRIRRAAGTRRWCRRSTCCRRSSRRSACRRREPVHGHDLLPLIRGEQTKVRDYACLGMDVEEFAIRTHLWHLIVPVEPDPDDRRGPPSSTASPRTAGTRTTSSSSIPRWPSTSS